MRSMIDAFCRVWADSVLRHGLAMACVERWLMERDIRLHVIECSSAKYPLFDGPSPMRHVLSPVKFWIRSKELAEQQAQSDIYIVSDDDHLVLGKTWLEDGLRVMKNHLDYGMLASWSINGEVPEKDGDEWVWDSDSIGCPCFIRKGIVKEFPDGPLAEYDGILTRHINALGWKTGFLRTLRNNHIGLGYSQVIPAHWNAP